MTISNETLGEFRAKVADGFHIYATEAEVRDLIAKIDEQEETIRRLQEESAARYADPGFATAKIYATVEEGTGYKIFREGRDWRWAYIEGSMLEISDENFSTQAEALRAAAANWEDSNGDPDIRIAATLRGLATRLERKNEVD